MSRTRVRFAVVGQGYFAQAAVLPAFARTPNAELVALFSDSPHKLDELAQKYGVEHKLGYDEFDDFLKSGAVDAVYITLPNAQHAAYTIRAARAGVHVLCEKPMAITEAECQEMIAACQACAVRFMVGYRLHFEAANLDAINIVQSGDLGEVRAFSSVFTMQVREGNTRVDGELGGGPLYDIGIYCINAARYLFADEPLEVTAFSASSPEDPRFREVEEQYAVAMRFPGNRLATFVAGFGAADCGYYELLGSKGTLRVEPAYEFTQALKHHLTVDGKTKTRTYARRDQVAPEIIYFSDCVMQGRPPEPSGVEGLADVRIIRAIEESARAGRTIAVEPVLRRARPSQSLEMRVAAHRVPTLVDAEPPMITSN